MLVIFLVAVAALFGGVIMQYVVVPIMVVIVGVVIELSLLAVKCLEALVYVVARVLQNLYEDYRRRVR